MTSRTRHSPVQVARTSYSGSTRSVPRHQPVPDSSSISFAQSSLHSEVMNPQYTLSSHAHGSRHQYNHWDAPLSNMPGNDDFLSVTGYDPMSYLDACYSSDTMSTPDLMDAQYTYGAGDTMSRHAAQTADDIMMNDYLPMDFDTCNPLMDGNTWTYSNGPMAPPSPPDEDKLDRYFASQGRHSSMYRDSAVVENLGPSKLLPYSGNRHSSTHPRPIRPSSGRHSSGSSSPELPPSPPKEDSGSKITARHDPRYNAHPDKDGWYHCPFTKATKDHICTHKPTKQKCIYAKYLDSHLRPYKCKYAKSGDDCEDTRFSSNACLFRHEREAHGKHNHGLNPYLCEYSDCDRSKDGNGFPRRWNQRDHMKRVHQWRETDSIASEDRHNTDKRRKGPSGPSSVPMRRSTSYARTAVSGNTYSREHHGSINMSRHSTHPQYVNPMQTGNLTGYSVSMEGVSFSHQPLTYGYQTVY